MRKRPAILLFGGLAVVPVGYVAWCSREFYLRADMPYLLDLPEDVRPIAEQAVEDSGLRKPQEFDFETFLYRLSDPYDPHPTRTQVSLIDRHLMGFRSDRIKPSFCLKEENGRWVAKDPSDFDFVRNWY